MKLYNHITLKVKAGDGGNGIIAWRREARDSLGGPAGGNGGNGGDVYIVADINLNSLCHLSRIKFIYAKNGFNGKGKSMNGKNGDDLFIKVPCGTNIYDLSNGHKIDELLEHNKQILICKGGVGGKGNLFFKSPKKHTPYMYENGDLAKPKNLKFELEYIADIGIVGLPNAGKSTLLSKISNAKPKIASFPFTTIIPVLGTVSYSDKKLIFADIPGLIEGSSKGVGLGNEFLMHVNRCKILIHLLDGSNIQELYKNIQIIETELLEYSKKKNKNIFIKPKLLIINKIDLLSIEELSFIKKEIDYLNPLYISGKTQINIEEFLNKVFALFDENTKHQENNMDLSYLEFNDAPEKHEIPKIWFENDIWYAESSRLFYWVNKIPATTMDNIYRLRNKIEELGIIDRLLQMGAKPLSEVNIYFFKFNL